MPTNTDRALDRRVAEVVMGWRVEGKPYGHMEGAAWRFVDSDGKVVSVIGNWPSQDELLVDGLPPFSADTPEGWAAMKGVVERMEQAGWSWKMTSGPGWHPAAAFWKEGDLPHQFGIRPYKADSLPEAVCRAAIAALEATDAVE